MHLHRKIFFIDKLILIKYIFTGGFFSIIIIWLDVNVDFFFGRMSTQCYQRCESECFSKTGHKLDVLSLMLSQIFFPPLQ